MNEEQLMKAIRKITSRGKTAEVRATPKGGYVVFEIVRREKMNIETDDKA